MNTDFKVERGCPRANDALKTFSMAPVSARDPRTSGDYPDEVRDRVGTYPCIQVLVVDTADAKRPMLPSKDSGIKWDTLAHRVIMDTSTDEILG